MKGNMSFRKFVPSCNERPLKMKLTSFSNKGNEKLQLKNPERSPMETDIDIDLREVYFLIMHFLADGPCHRTYGQLWNELLEHQLLPRRYHAWYSRTGARSGDENDDGLSFPLSYNKLVERYPHIEKDHLVKLLKQLILNAVTPTQGIVGGSSFTAASVPTLLGTGSFSLLGNDHNGVNNVMNPTLTYLRWPHTLADQVRGLSLREIGGGFTRHHRAPSIRAACYAIAKPSTMVQKMQNIKKLRGHLNAVYCAIFDRSGRYVITGSDDRLVKIWSMETAYCLASCRGHEGDITDLAVSSNNFFVASASNDCIIRVWHLPDGVPISVLRGHTGAVTAIAFCPRPNSPYQLLSSSDDGTCRIWDARYSHLNPRIYVPRPPDTLPGAGKNSGPSSSTSQHSHQIFCCAFNASGTVFVTGSSDTFARVWNACKSNTDESEPNHEIDVLAGHENDVNYVQFSGCNVASRFYMADTSKEENIPKFRNSWFNHDNIVTCSRDGSAIIWIPRSRRSHGKAGRWTRAYHLKVPPPPMPPQPPRGGPRQRILPTPRGVNMIVWSLDNRFVLAAIMDCRICVWNAVDGSLVHSLTGHTESTYVLDVHPFNPRIAMSAGYDGKTIVWDIWEGTPIRVYEIGRFKLVDGKFSPDGTSIILSDDVGQLYILSTGQGESQQDAKYDQFFLGDYRPLIQDAQGTVLDQETQLQPYKRNMQDLLCDASMIPYPEPYQSMYQQRRLGALGIEWRPSSVRFAVGADMNQEFQMIPVVDLDLLLDPLPEFVDAMDWEPENEVHSDDTDSEYNVTEEFSSGGEQGSLGSISSGDSECSSEDIEGDHKDFLRRSKRKKQKAEVEITTSSGRRVKRKNLDACDGESLGNNWGRKSKHGHKASRKKSSSSKSLRPQRIAARNARTLFSKLKGGPADGEDDDHLDVDSSESDSTLNESNTSSEESEESLQNNRRVHSKGKEIFVDESEDVNKLHECLESRLNAGNRKRLVLKLPIRDLNKFVLEPNRKPDLLGSSSKSTNGANGVNQNSSQYPDYTSSDVNGGMIGRSEEHRKVESQLEVFDGFNGKIKWGGFKARTTKRSKMGEPLLSTAYAGSSSYLQNCSMIEDAASGQPKLENKCGKFSSSSQTQYPGGQIDETFTADQQNLESCTPEELDGMGNDKESYSFVDIPYDELPRHDQMVDDNITNINRITAPAELKENPTSVSTKLRIMSKRTSKDNESLKFKIKPYVEDGRNVGSNVQHDIPCVEENVQPEVPDYDGNGVSSSVHGGLEGIAEPGARVDEAFRPVLQDLQKSSSHDKMYNVVYRRSKSSRNRKLQSNSGGVDAKTSNASNHTDDVGNDFHGATTDRFCQTLSTESNASVLDACTSNSIRLREGREGLRGSSRGIRKSFFNVYNEDSPDELRPGLRVSVGLRSTRNRRSSYYIQDVDAPERRKSHQPGKNSWLMSMHEERFRYIPQMGDEVVYLRQGHHQYIEAKKSNEVGPWKTVKGNMRAVEFCRIIDLEYSQHPGSGESCCKMRLQFVDCSSDLNGQSFILTLPEVTGFPDFLVERSRYDAAMQKNWTTRDKCQVWWNNEDDQNGSWWEGRIVEVRPKSLDFPDSPWERYYVQYKSNPSEKLPHSPWEFYDSEAQWEPSHLNDEIRNKLLHYLYKLEASGGDQDRYGIQKLKEVSQRTGFMNRFPVPLSLDVIQARVENNYYRCLEAVKHDISTMLSNAESYFGRNVELSSKMRRLSDWFTRKLSSL